MIEKPAWKSTLWEIIRFVIITLLIVVPIRAYVAQPFIVSGLSMVPSFDNGEYLIIDELSYLLREPRRDEVIVFRYPKDPSKFFIKRIINLPGETVTTNNKTYTLGPDEYFVLGDNRLMSLDSRAWGPVKKSLIKGRVLFRLFPFNRLAYLPAAGIKL